MANLSAFGGAQPITPGGLVELGYSEFATTQQSLSTTQQSVTNGPITVVCDGSPVLIEISGMASIPQGNQINISLYRDGSYINQYWLYRYNGYPTAVGDYHNLTRWYRDTPSAGTHTYEVKAFASNTSGTVTINANPSFQTRVSKIVQQNNGLKPFWTPPLVTQLPSNPTVGDTVIYAADATNGVYWNLYYDGIGSYPWKFVGGPRMEAYVAGSQSTSSSTPVAIGGPTLTLPLAGCYTYGIQGNVLYASGAVMTYQRIAVGGTAVYDAWAGTDVSGFMHEAGGAVNDNSGKAAGATVSHLSASPQSVTVGFYERRLWITPIRVAA